MATDSFPLHLATLASSLVLIHVISLRLFNAVPHSFARAKLSAGTQIASFCVPAGLCTSARPEASSNINAWLGLIKRGEAAAGGRRRVGLGASLGKLLVL